MTILRLLVLSMLPAFMSESHAGPCASEIDTMQARVDATVAASASGGPSAPESSGALIHRQPTPGSIAEAEARLGDPSASTAAVANAAIARAREADGRGDKGACDQAIAEVRRLIGP